MPPLQQLHDKDDIELYLEISSRPVQHCPDAVQDFFQFIKPSILILCGIL